MLAKAMSQLCEKIVIDETDVQMAVDFCDEEPWILETPQQGPLRPLFSAMFFTGRLFFLQFTTRKTEECAFLTKKLQYHDLSRNWLRHLIFGYAL
ncbi:hypothetical protein KIN20_027548 [Parelaphostrongylus tenuis]|uniref:Uncharacterized protein n=1 Tax=Parelaphostrongylus tenuis TaxID=148309 RepID=A0AAD5WDW6_PARTN|nr:hypothetical protein KIN20_027548 [Parelaphostrongylus tenuis]